MKSRIIAICFSIFSLAVFAEDVVTDSAARTHREPLATIEALDVSRYMGSWYEIAKFPNWFQKKCVGHTKAGYTAKADGSVQVIDLDEDYQLVAVSEPKRDYLWILSRTAKVNQKAHDSLLERLVVSHAETRGYPSFRRRPESRVHNWIPGRARNDEAFHRSVSA